MTLFTPPKDGSYRSIISLFNWLTATPLAQSCYIPQLFYFTTFTIHSLCPLGQCSAETSLSTYGNYSWPTVNGRNTSVLNCVHRCPNEYTATRRCDVTGLWDDPVYTDCPTPTACAIVELGRVSSLCKFRGPLYPPVGAVLKSTHVYDSSLPQMNITDNNVENITSQMGIVAMVTRAEPESQTADTLSSIISIFESTMDVTSISMEVYTTSSLMHVICQGRTKMNVDRSALDVYSAIIMLLQGRNMNFSEATRTVIWCTDITTVKIIVYTTQNNSSCYTSINYYMNTKDN